ncbi:hypothetical protein OH77DRAFT_1520863 [Trametes cingulata]|nr:hypothetical protein OH77DRAFT_1520863 [Trametes cingulata]
MRTTALSALVLLGATLAASAPIRVVVTTHQEVSSKVHYGSVLSPIPVDPSVGEVAAMRDPLGMIDPASLPHAQPVPMPVHASGKGSGRHLCQSLREKALAASNRFRAIFGLAPIEHDRDTYPLFPVPGSHGGVIQVLPIRPHSYPPGNDPHGPVMSVADGAKPVPLPAVMPFVGTPVRPALVEGEEGWAGRHAYLHRMQRMHRHHGSFLRRVHHALMALGPWEGRAVAFVLGCGIGVLLRMMWVMVLVTVRAIRGGSANGDERDGYDVVFDTDADAEAAELLVPPPQYTVVGGDNEVVPAPPKADEKSEKV